MFQTRLARMLSAVLLAVGLCGPLSAEALELSGSWHLLVHYRDAGSEDPEADRWYDRVWKFQQDGRRVSWTEYKIVVFDDPSGRFETLGFETRSRVLSHWEPNPRQQRNIREGLEVVPREARSKTLRGSARRGFRSSGGLRSSSASVIAYHELWSIENLEDLPVFARDDVLGSARTENMQGVTRYTTLEVLDGGRVLRGGFERDDALRGSFRLTRAGDARLREGDEVDRKAELDDIRLGFSVDRGALADELLGVLAEPDRAAHRQRVRELVRAMLEKDLRDRGQDPRQHERRILPLVDQIEQVLVDEGASLDEVEAMLRRGELRP